MGEAEEELSLRAEAWMEYRYQKHLNDDDQRFAKFKMAAKMIERLGEALGLSDQVALYVESMKATPCVCGAPSPSFPE